MDGNEVSGKLLIVDDEQAQMQALCDTLEAEGYQPVGFTSALEALEHLRGHNFDLVLTDLSMPEMDGVAFLRAASKIDQTLAGIVMTGNGSIDTAVEAMKAGALDYILKPFKLSTVRPVLERSLAMQRLRLQNALLLAEKKASDKRIRESEKELRLLADSMPQIAWSARSDGSIDFFNRRWYEFVGTEEQDPRHREIASILHPDDLARWQACWHAAVSERKIFQIECRFWERKTDSYRWHLGRALPLCDDAGRIVKWSGTYTDIDDHKRLNEHLEGRVAERTAALQRSLDERTALLKEVQHRVRNNLQVICSLLSRQAEHSDPAQAEALEAAYDRVSSMSLIHDQLYQSGTYAYVDFADYIHLFAPRFLESRADNRTEIDLDLQQVTSVRLSIDLAIPCALIFNELLSNAVKHAFNSRESGQIQVTLFRSSRCSQLTVADNGCGIPETISFDRAGSLGFSVVRMLATQIRAKVTVEKARGSAFTLEWPLPEIGESEVPRMAAIT